jgi:hypothetical protein
MRRAKESPLRSDEGGLVTIADVVREPHVKLIVGGCPQSDRKPQLSFTFSLLVILGHHGMLPEVRTGEFWRPNESFESTASFETIAQRMRSKFALAHQLGISRSN